VICNSVKIRREKRLELSNWTKFFLGLAVATAMTLIVGSKGAYEVCLCNTVKAEPIGDFEKNEIYTVESMHVIDDFFFGAIHNMSNEPIFVQGEYIKLFDYQGRFIDAMYLENPMRIPANSYGYYNTTTPAVDFEYYIIKLVLQNEM
jgi:hypothetical protein